VLKQLMNGNNGLLLILTGYRFESDLSVSVTVKKCDCKYSVKIKVLNFKIKFIGHC